MMPHDVLLSRKFVRPVQLYPYLKMYARQLTFAHKSITERQTLRCESENFPAVQGYVDTHT